jgi:hypothetical protein
MKEQGKRSKGWEGGMGGGREGTYLAGVGAPVLVLPEHARVFFVDADGVADHTGGATG